MRRAEIRATGNAAEFLWERENLAVSFVISLLPLAPREPAAELPCKLPTHLSQIFDSVGIYKVCGSEQEMYKGGFAVLVLTRWFLFLLLFSSSSL